MGLGGLALGPLSEAPFNPAARRPGPWNASGADAPSPGAATPAARPLGLTHAFHSADYLIDIARAHLAMAAQTPGDRARAEGRAAADLLQAALDHRPTDAFAWTLRSVAETTGGRPAEALAALRASWRFAPYLLRLAQLRTQIGARLWPLLTSEDRDLLARDLATVRDFDAPGFDAQVAASRRLALLARERGLLPEDPP